MAANLGVGAPCWVATDGPDGFTRCTVVAFDDATSSLTVREPGGAARSLPATEVEPCNPDNQVGCKDNTELM